MPRRFFVALVSYCFGVALVSGQQRDAGDMVARIRAEGLQRSRALALYQALTDRLAPD